MRALEKLKGQMNAMESIFWKERNESYAVSYYLTLRELLEPSHMSDRRVVCLTYRRLAFVNKPRPRQKERGSPCGDLCQDPVLRIQCMGPPPRLPAATVTMETDSPETAVEAGALTPLPWSQARGAPT